MGRKLALLVFVLFAAVVVIISRSMSGGSVDATVISDKKDGAEALYERANGYIEQGEQDRAIKDLNTIIARFEGSPYYEKALKDMATIYIQTGEYAKGELYLKQLRQPLGTEKLKKTEEVSNNMVSEEETGAESAPSMPQAPEDKPAAEGDDKEASSQPTIIQKIRSGDYEGLPENIIRSNEPDVVEYVVKGGDSLYKISRKFDTTIKSIKKMNLLTSDTIRVGQKLRIDTSRYSIFVDKSDNILVLKKNGEPYKTYRVSTGKNNSTPVGVFNVTDKMIEPAWTKPGVGIIVPEDEEYELGARWIPISVPGYGIHGTNDESTIGTQVTAGCVRMKNNDVIEVYDTITRGTVVEIVD